MDMKEFDVLDASLTLRDLSREQKKAIVRLLELQIEETAQVYTAKYAAQQSVHLTALRRWLAFVISLLVVLILVVIYYGGGR